MDFKGFPTYILLFILAFMFLQVSESLSRTNDEIPLLTEKPSWLKVCRKSDPLINECLKELFIQMFPALATGIPDLAIDPFEPLHIDRVGISKGNGPITLAGSLFNMTVAGPSKAIPIYSDIDLEKNTFKFGINLPYLTIKSLYNLKGKILVLPLVGHGLSEIFLTDVKTNVSTTLNFPKIDGRQLFTVDTMKVKFTVGAMKVKFENLFNGNKLLGVTVNTFLNKNALEVIDELSDNISDSLSEIFMGLMNNIFSKLPTDLWLVDEISESTS